MSELKDKNILVIVESPNKCAHIKEYLQKAGYKNVHVVASVGHIMALANGGNYYNSGIDPDNKFDLSLEVSEDKKDVVNKLKEQVKWAEEIFLMTDGDREGEAISWSLIKFLKLKKGTYKRAVTHEITPKAVVAAIENPIELNEELVDAALARMTIDKMLGFSLSPIAKTYIGAKSVGRCQSAGLKLIVDREREIQDFKPETYFDLYLNFEKNKTKFKAKYVGTNAGEIDHLKTQKEVDKIKAACKGKYIIEGVSKKERQDSPKPPFSTATYQQEAASKLGLSVKDAMSCAQKLFEGGYITYHRTDDATYSPEFLPVLKSFIEKEYGKKAYTNPRVGKKTENAQEGHEALRVTDLTLTPARSSSKITNTLLNKVYKLIWQRTVATALPNAVISETGYLIDNNGQKFLLTSNEVISEGYRTVYNYKDEDTVEDGPVKETFVQGEELANTSLEDVKKATKPKPRFTEATFIKELQKREIGRPSTYATIVDTILSTTRGYCTLDGKSITPTDRGMQLSAFLDRAFPDLINIDYTKEMEKGLDMIANGKTKKLSFLTNFYNVLEESIKNNPERGAQDINIPNCPKCGASMITRRSRFGKLFFGCSKYPHCNGIVNIK